MLWIVLVCHPVTYRLLLCNKRLNKCPILEVPLSAFRMQLTSHSGWTEQDFAFIFCFWDLVMTPTNMGYSEIELPEVSSQHHLAALMLASLSTCHMQVEYQLWRISPGLQMLVSTLPFVNNPESPLAPSGSNWRVPGSQKDHKHALDSFGISLHNQ